MSGYILPYYFQLSYDPQTSTHSELHDILVANNVVHDPHYTKRWLIALVLARVLPYAEAARARGGDPDYRQPGFDPGACGIGQLCTILEAENIYNDRFWPRKRLEEKVRTKVLDQPPAGGRSKQWC